MKFYLSSYGFGRGINGLKNMLPLGSILGHVNNSQDISDINPKVFTKLQTEEINQLGHLGFKAEPLDLRNYFGKEQKLREKLLQLNGIWVSGGNTFVLRQAMKLSGFDIIFNELKSEKNFLYAGYSAGICVLCDSLKYIQNVDNPNFFPYTINRQVIGEGLNAFNYGLLLHYDSDHRESKAIDKDVLNCINNKWLFKALRDGEVIILNE